ncbi:hypothetical protein [Derxia gummosa]|uniref:Uncharacterized protein n=1 Tax=Derxia gummosa DSM 723 TaxID=1121388 RepID=A0A8B6X2F7_9BURK|nr:hypothetical protein [Derxia gummosa]
MDAHPLINESSVREAYRQVGTEKALAVARDSDLIALSVSILNAGLAGMEGKLAGALGSVDGVTDAGGKLAGNQGVKTAAASAQIINQTLALLKLANNTSPGVLVGTVGAMFTKKVSLAMGLADDNKQAQLIGAWSDLLSSLLTAGVTAATITTPVGVVLMAGALLQVGVSIYQTAETMASK